MNAYDPKSLGEPDYQLRLDGHKETLDIVKHMNDQSFNEDFIRIMIFNSSYMIRMVCKVLFNVIKFIFENI